MRKNSTEKGKINMKWWKRLLVLLVAGVVCGAIMRVMALWVSKNTLSASAAEQTYGDLTYVLHNGNAEITGCAAGVTALEIPAEIDGSPVTAVGDSAFLKQQKLQTVSLPDSVQSIGTQAFFRLYQLAGDHSSGRHTVCRQTPLFSGCTKSWKKAVLGDSVETLGSSVFSGCESLAEVQLSANLQKMGGSVFQNCTALKTVAIPEQVQTLGGSTFSGCSRLYQVTLPAKMTEIQSRAFEDCPKLETLTLPESLNTLGYGHSKIVPVCRTSACRSRSQKSATTPLLTAPHWSRQQFPETC